MSTTGKFRRFFYNRLATVGLVILVAIVALTLAAPILGLQNPNETNLEDRALPPGSDGYMLGTDELGRDLLSRLIWGTRTSLAVGISATAIAAVIGSLIGIVSAFYGGWLDNTLMRGIDMIMAFPYILLALAIVAVLGAGLFNALIAISIVNIPFFARNVRGATVSLVRLEYVDSARLSGKSNVKILYDELLPNVLPVIFITISTTVGWMILETAGLSFLGLGAQPPQADLGSMLGNGRNLILTAPHVATLPGLVILVLVIGINLVGDGLRDVLDPYLSSGALVSPRPATEVDPKLLRRKRTERRTAARTARTAARDARREARSERAVSAEAPIEQAPNEGAPGEHAQSNADGAAPETSAAHGNPASATSAAHENPAAETSEAHRNPAAETSGDGSGALALSIRNLQTWFWQKQGAVHAADDVSFDVPQGAAIGVMGESGSGKSVTALSILGLVPTPPGRIMEGSVSYRGEELVGSNLERLQHFRGNRIAYIFQNPMTSLNPLISVGEQIAEAVRRHQGSSREQAMAKARELMEQVQIPDARNRLTAYPHELSGGMRQRVGIAIALANDPDIVIADEPTTALDVTIQAQILRLLQQLRTRYGMSLVFISHDFGVISALCERVVVMYAGEIVEIGTVDEIYNNPLHPYTRRLMACVPQIGDRGREMATIPGLPPALDSLPGGCRFADRCDMVLDACRQQTVELRRFGRREARCIRAEESL
jgi:peptide/nickel transport system permease protein